MNSSLGDENYRAFSEKIRRLVDEIERLRAAIGRYLAENDTEGFGCACEPNYTCGPCSAHERQQVLRDALTANAAVSGRREAGDESAAGIPSA